MAKAKKNKKKKSGASKRTSSSKKGKSKKAKKKPVAGKKKKKIKKLAKISRPAKKSKKLKSPPADKESKKKKKEKTAEVPDPVVELIPAEKSAPTASELAKERARLRALAKAKEAIKAKERQKNAILASDTAAYEKQMKLAEPKHKLILEYIIHASPVLLYEFITSPSGLSEWFADDVNIVGSIYSFYWDGARQQARVLLVKENKSIRFQWTDRSPNTYFEFRIEKNELTEELSLIITDFAEIADDMNSLEVLWQGQVQRLMKVIGSKV